MAKNKINNTLAETKNNATYILLRLLVHFTGAVQFSYGVYYFHTYVYLPDNTTQNSFGGKFKYLTFLNAIIQALYYTISLINDFVGTNEVAPQRLPLVRKIKDYMMAVLAFPIALSVGISFWVLYAIDRELILPQIWDVVFPSWLNHILHTNIVVFIVLEMFISFRAYPPRTKGITGLTTFLFFYLIWIHIVKYYSHAWVYPFLEVLSLPQRIVFFLGSLVLTLILYMSGEILNNFIWSKELKLAQRKHK